MAAIEDLCILSNLMIIIDFVNSFVTERPMCSFALKLDGFIRVSVFSQKKKKSVYHNCRKVHRNMSKTILSEIRNLKKTKKKLLVIFFFVKLKPYFNVIHLLKPHHF